jgi:uncharacterized protein YjeT (DUF2065 family)
MMDIGWAELARYLGGAFALYLVLEGILPFVNPAAAQRLMAKLATTEPRAIALGRIDQHGGGTGTAVDGAQWVRTWL